MTNMATIEAWVKPTGFSGAGTRESIVHVSSTLGVYLTSSDQLQCQLGTGSGPTVAAPAGPVNQWTHVACTYDQNQLTIYVDQQICADHGGC